MASDFEVELNELDQRLEKAQKAAADLVSGLKRPRSVRGGSVSVIGKGLGALEPFEGLLVIVLADDALTGEDPKRSLNAYDALKMRVSDDVRATGRDNPLAALVRLESSRLQTEAGP